jgi:hypothetical protein
MILPSKALPVNCFISVGAPISVITKQLRHLVGKAVLKPQQNKQDIKTLAGNRDWVA